MEKPQTGLARLDLVSVYRDLLDAFGPRGWWPLDHRAGQPGLDAEGYHPQGVPPDFGPADIWCIFAGAILTQRSTWLNARRALAALLRLCARSMDSKTGRHAGGNQTSRGQEPAAWLLPVPGCLSGLALEELGEAIRPSGFFRQKAQRLKELEVRLLDTGFFDPDSPCPSRKDLRALKGLGPESADVLWAYARLETCFVSDAYTARIFARLAGLTPDSLNYQACQEAVHAAWGISPDSGGPGHTLAEARRWAGTDKTGDELREFHALLVELGKRCCRSVADCPPCPLRGRCVASLRG